MTVIFRALGQLDYIPVWRAMQRFTDLRQQNTLDEIWLLQHPPVYTQGMAGKTEHVLNAGNIPVVEIDRGGQVTYHGPGQLVVYFLLDLARRQLAPRQLVTMIEQALIDLLACWQIEAYAKADAPGIYVGQAKIASVGLRIRRNASYHGLALNVDMALAPFLGINPCGYTGLAMCQLKDFVSDVAMDQVTQEFERILRKLFV